MILPWRAASPTSQTTTLGVASSIGWTALTVAEPRAFLKLLSEMHLRTKIKERRAFLELLSEKHLRSEITEWRAFLNRLNELQLRSEFMERRTLMKLPSERQLRSELTERPAFTLVARTHLRPFRCLRLYRNRDGLGQVVEGKVEQVAEPPTDGYEEFSIGSESIVASQLRASRVPFHEGKAIIMALMRDPALLRKRAEIVAFEGIHYPDN